MKKKLIERYLDKSTIVEVYSTTTKQNVETKDEKRIVFNGSNIDHQIAYLFAKTARQHDLIKELTDRVDEDHENIMNYIHKLDLHIFDLKFIVPLVLFLIAIGVMIVGLVLK